MNSSDRTASEVLGPLYLADVRERMLGLKSLGEGALTQLRDDEWHTVLSDDGNSAAVLIQHLSGNMHARWGALRSGYRPGTEGEPETRDRDAEFTDTQHTPAELWRRWHDGWAVYLEVLNALTPEDLTAPLTIRGETHAVLQALQRQVMHYSGHVYQVVLLVKTLRGAQWQTLSIPRGESAGFNAAMQKRHR